MAHVAGVLNALGSVGAAPLFFGTSVPPILHEGVERGRVPIGGFWDFPDARVFAVDRAFDAWAGARIRSASVGFVYQRYSLGSYAGLRLAVSSGAPLVLEYNGSEIWVQRHWAQRPLRYEGLCAAIETLNLRCADVVVVVSDALRDEIVARGVDPSKVLVNPNGVDLQRFDASISGTGIRERFGLGSAPVIGFIGTFGPWHGAEVLAEAFVRLRRFRSGDARLLWIGDGVCREAASRIVREGGAAEASVFAGHVPQAAAPEYLAACDVVVAPHVPNPDGTRFFGSPTKLFEYMAMGKGIVASDLDQIGQLLRDEETALLVKPGDADSLANGLARMIDDPSLRRRLGETARREAVTNHSWDRHVERIVQKLRERCG